MCHSYRPWLVDWKGNWFLIGWKEWIGFPVSNLRALSTLSHIARKICKKCVSDSQCQISNTSANIRFRNPIWCTRLYHNMDDMDEDVKFYPHDKIIKISYRIIMTVFCWPRLVVIQVKTSETCLHLLGSVSSGHSLSPHLAPETIRHQTIISFLD